LLAASPSFAAEWQNSVSYGANTRMDLYVPDEPATPTPIVVTLHYCGGNSQNAHPWLESYADDLGFAIITPGAGGQCFDAAPQRTGERANVVAMVDYVVTMHGGDATRVFAVGASSGACMTQALLAAYPEVFAGGSSLAGVPAGAWTAGNSYGWSTSGTSGGQGWGDKVRQANPGYTGARPRVQLWHGQGDTTLTYSQSYPAQVAQWTNVFGVDDSDATMESVKPMGAQDTWARTSYKDASGTVVVEANSGPSSVPHDLTGRGLWGDVVRFFALDQPITPGSGGAGGMAGGGSGGQAGGPAAGTSGGGNSGGVAGAGGAGMPVAGGGSGGAPIAGGGSGMSGAGSGGTPAATGGAGAGPGPAGAGGAGSPATSGRGGQAGGVPIAGAGSPSIGTNDDDDARRVDSGGCRVGSAGGAAEGTGLAALGLAALGLFARRRRR
jgi:poly(hydroxyalkanoate) depolymerase family esterase